MIFISLGVNCFTATALKLYNLKKCSYMFDWSCTNVDNIISILKNYNIENYQKLINNPWIENGVTSYGLLTFVHHKDISYRERVIKRFFNVLDSHENKVFIITFKFKENIFLLLLNSLLVSKRYKNIKNIPIFSCLISLTKFKIAVDKQSV